MAQKKETQNNAPTIPDHSEMREEIQEFVSAKDALTSKAMSIVVQDEQSRDEAVNFITSTLKPLRKKIDDKRKKYPTQLRQIANEWDKEFQPALKAVDGLIGYLNQSVIEFNKAQEEKAREEQKRLEELAEQERKQAEERGEESQIPEAIPQMADFPQRSIKTESGTTTIKKVSYLEIYDEFQLPREYLFPNKTKIEQDVRAGKTVPGARLAYRDEVATRTK